ncbi:signal recognition particle-docking protein FtsY [Ahniella affigens]|uniref:Signal recognition particle receptor FtsY n=1 Tax=Ahniella affigens TaxID=2021234 RepID=A0A2P1PN86_9GAMM|nr:signal recognition particle-docking protein FtsY [Ahniella affigens]AVP96301.1 signal recognition particle-docking protein FtsY [Ahniella affigens]
MFSFFKKKPEVAAPIANPAPAEVSNAPELVDTSPLEQGNWRDRLRSSMLGRSLGALFSGNPKLDDALLDELETLLLTADVGVGATEDLLNRLRPKVQGREFADAAALMAAVRGHLLSLLRPVEKPLQIDSSKKPFVMLVVGINGAGKTTSIGKIARWLKLEGQSVMLAAGDTFRAAAVEQLKVWGERNQIPVIAQTGSADSASVIFDGLQAARARGADVLIADTAGRLHTQGGLMDELAKVKRVLTKLDPDAPHETLLVLDGNTGQNAVSQVRQFHQTVGLTGLVVTKLDGTAKGGVIFALAREFRIPIRFVGVGEGLIDLRTFDAEEFLDGLLPTDLGGGAG